MGDSVIYTEFHHLGVHHNHLHVLWFGLEDNTHNQGVDAYRLTGASGACNKQMGHLSYVRHHHLPADILAHSKGQTGLVVFKSLRLQQIPQVHHIILFVRHLDSHCRLAGDGCFYTDVRSSQAQLDIIGQSHYLADLHALFRQKLIPGHGRAAADVSDRHAHPEIVQGLLQLYGSGLVLIPREGSGILGPLLKQGGGREHVFLLDRLFLFLDFLGHRQI